jgi:precorrin-6B methylase 1
MPFTTNGKRDYKKELRWEHTTHPKRVKERAERNAARKIVGLKKGDPRQVDHKRPLVAGGSNKKSNLRITSAKTNLHKEAMRKKRNG